ncbi:ATP-binding protein [Lewinella sp. LCG006]|uniref:ATP-binding protein n=1 Tax=Lewinella sp. LCG006 TaxID=3231911 RepID=UPI00345FF555
MKTLEKTPDLAQQLTQIETLNGLPTSDLQWLVEKSEYVSFDEGEEMFTPGMEAEYMFLILTGAYKIQMPQGGEFRDLGIEDAPTISGLLPFSRMKEIKAHGTVVAHLTGLRLHKDHFVEMVNFSYALVQRLVGAMSNRIRDFTQNRLQSEKLMSLGKLSAGLAHELNNPASAIVRSVEELYARLHNSPEDFKEVITMKITSEETDQINEIIFPKINQLGDFEDLSLMEQESRKDDLIDWLEDHHVQQAEDLADTFVEFSVTEEDLEQIADILDTQALGPVLRWAQRVFSTEKIVAEIKEAANRIAELVSSVKSYTHMDQSSSMEARNIHEGLKSTLMMLKHKLKQKQITLEKELNLDLPPVEIFPGEINQVWTNIIDNALDAMPAKGRLHLKTYQRYNNVIVEITDNGHGIPEEVINHIFDPFFTTKGVGEGTGLGLEVSHRIIEKHRGTIDVSSQPGKTTFSVCLPIKH